MRLARRLSWVLAPILALSACHHGLRLPPVAAVPPVTAPAVSAPAEPPQADPPETAEPRPKAIAPPPRPLGETLEPLKGGHIVKSARDRYSLRLPKEWKLDENPAGGASLAAVGPTGPEGRAAVLVLVHDLPEPVDVTTLAQAMDDELHQTTPDIKLIESHRGTINGCDAAWQVLRYHNEDADLVAMSFTVVSGQRMVAVKCTTPATDFERRRPIFEGIGGSIKLG